MYSSADYSQSRVHDVKHPIFLGCYWGQCIWCVPQLVHLIYSRQHFATVLINYTSLQIDYTCSTFHLLSSAHHLKKLGRSSAYFKASFLLWYLNLATTNFPQLSTTLLYKGCSRMAQASMPLSLVWNQEFTAHYIYMKSFYAPQILTFNCYVRTARVRRWLRDHGNISILGKCKHSEKHLHLLPSRVSPITCPLYSLLPTSPLTLCLQ